MAFTGSEITGWVITGCFITGAEITGSLIIGCITGCLITGSIAGVMAVLLGVVARGLAPTPVEIPLVISGFTVNAGDVNALLRVVVGFVDNVFFNVVVGTVNILPRLDVPGSTGVNALLVTLPIDGVIACSPGFFETAGLAIP